MTDRPASCRPITWADLEHRRPANTYQLTNCPSCAHVVARRLPEGTYHRHVTDARAGREALAACPKCGARLQRSNLSN